MEDIQVQPFLKRETKRWNVGSLLFMTPNQGPFKLTVLLPTLIWGPMVPGQPHLNTSANVLVGYMDGSVKEGIGATPAPWVFPNLLLPTSLPRFLMSFFTQRWNGSGGENLDQSEAVMKFMWSKSWKGDRECLQDGGRCPGRGPGPHWGHRSWRGRWAHPVDWRVSPLRGQWEMKMKFGC